MRNLTDQINELEVKNEESTNKLNDLKIQLNQINLKNKKQINKIENGYKSEISLLNKKIKQLEEKLKYERKNNLELVELREIVFKIKNDDNINNVSYDLQDVIGENKIMIVGGTPEWRKRLKDKHSQILTLDGFKETFDVRIFDNIDFVFFYVGYMSHATYYKAVNVLKNKDIPFKYIGRTNIESVENEMVEELIRLTK
ncbi:MAG: DUF2325 domain-containing protein [Firmicutes bacterium]|nr:DUF2325 domain-containing protein [Bacillota bacterium]